MANRIFQRYNNLLSEATFLRQYYSKSYITDLKQTFINLQLSQCWVYDGINSFWKSTVLNCMVPLQTTNRF